MRNHQKRFHVLIFVLLLLSSGCSMAKTDPGKEKVSSEEVAALKETSLSENTEGEEQTTTEYVESVEQTIETEQIVLSRSSLRIEDVPEYESEPYVEINGNQPEFSNEEKACLESFENYSELDDLGRCGVAYANVCPELQPTEERGQIGPIQPSGWQTIKYNDLIEGNYLYNRCHLIGYQLAGENSNECNLITGTRYLNMVSMLTFENMVSSYISETGNHVLYRVTPVFEGENLVASGVQMEGWSVEDGGEGICFNVFCYNVQPGIVIDYKTGDSREESEILSLAKREGDELQGEDAPARQIPETMIESETETTESEILVVDIPTEENQVSIFILNTSRKKIHLPSCNSVEQMADHNKKKYTGTIADLRKEGYQPCQNCLNRFPKERKDSE